MARVFVILDARDKYVIHTEPTKEAANAWVERRRAQDKLLVPKWEEWNKQEAQYYANKRAALANFEKEWAAANPPSAIPGEYPLGQVEIQESDFGS